MHKPTLLLLISIAWMCHAGDIFISKLSRAKLTLEKKSGQYSLNGIPFTLPVLETYRIEYNHVSKLNDSCGKDCANTIVAPSCCGCWAIDNPDKTLIICDKDTGEWTIITNNKGFACCTRNINTYDDDCGCQCNDCENIAVGNHFNNMFFKTSTCFNGTSYGYPNPRGLQLLTKDGKSYEKDKYGCYNEIHYRRKREIEESQDGMYAVTFKASTKFQVANVQRVPTGISVYVELDHTWGRLEMDCEGTMVYPSNLNKMGVLDNGTYVFPTLSSAPGLACTTLILNQPNGKKKASLPRLLPDSICSGEKTWMQGLPGYQSMSDQMCKHKVPYQTFAEVAIILISTIFVFVLIVALTCYFSKWALKKTDSETEKQHQKKIERRAGMAMKVLFFGIGLFLTVPLALLWTLGFLILYPTLLVMGLCVHNSLRHMSGYYKLLGWWFITFLGWCYRLNHDIMEAQNAEGSGYYWVVELALIPVAAAYPFGMSYRNFASELKSVLGFYGAILILFICLRAVCSNRVVVNNTSNAFSIDDQESYCSSTVDYVKYTMNCSVGECFKLTYKLIKVPCNPECSTTLYDSECTQTFLYIMIGVNVLMLAVGILIIYTLVFKTLYVFAYGHKMCYKCSEVKYFPDHGKKHYWLAHCYQCNKYYRFSKIPIHNQEVHGYHMVRESDYVPRYNWEDDFAMEATTGSSNENYQELPDPPQLPEQVPAEATYLEPSKFGYSPPKTLCALKLISDVHQASCGTAEAEMSVLSILLFLYVFRQNKIASLFFIPIPVVCALSVEAIGIVAISCAGLTAIFALVCTAMGTRVVQNVIVERVRANIKHKEHIHDNKSSLKLSHDQSKNKTTKKKTSKCNPTHAMVLLCLFLCISVVNAEEEVKWQDAVSIDGIIILTAFLIVCLFSFLGYKTLILMLPVANGLILTVSKSDLTYVDGRVSYKSRHEVWSNINAGSNLRLEIKVDQHSLPDIINMDFLTVGQCAQYEGYRYSGSTIIENFGHACCSDSGHKWSDGGCQAGVDVNKERVPEVWSDWGVQAGSHGTTCGSLAKNPACFTTWWGGVIKTRIGLTGYQATGKIKGVTSSRIMTRIEFTQSTIFFRNDPYHYPACEMDGKVYGDYFIHAENFCETVPTYLNAWQCEIGGELQTISLPKCGTCTVNGYTPKPTRVTGCTSDCTYIYNGTSYCTTNTAKHKIVVGPDTINDGKKDTCFTGFIHVLVSIGKYKLSGACPTIFQGTLVECSGCDSEVDVIFGDVTTLCELSDCIQPISTISLMPCSLSECRDSRSVVRLADLSVPFIHENITIYPEVPTANVQFPTCCAWDEEYVYNRECVSVQEDCNQPDSTYTLTYADGTTYPQIFGTHCGYETWITTGCVTTMSIFAKTKDNKLYSEFLTAMTSDLRIRHEHDQKGDLISFADVCLPSKINAPARFSLIVSGVKPKFSLPKVNAWLVDNCTLYATTLLPVYDYNNFCLIKSENYGYFSLVDKSYTVSPGAYPISISVCCGYRKEKIRLGPNHFEFEILSDQEEIGSQYVVAVISGGEGGNGLNLKGINLKPSFNWGLFGGIGSVVLIIILLVVAVYLCKSGRCQGLKRRYKMLKAKASMNKDDYERHKKEKEAKYARKDKTH